MVVEVSAVSDEPIRDVNVGTNLGRPSDWRSLPLECWPVAVIRAEVEALRSDLQAERSRADRLAVAYAEVHDIVQRLMGSEDGAEPIEDDLWAICQRSADGPHWDHCPWEQLRVRVYLAAEPSAEGGG